METSENAANRASRISRLPGPSAPSGLSELSESQHNTRNQSAIPALSEIKNLKREIPQPAISQPEPKRKLLSERAAEYLPKPAHSYGTRANVVKGLALTSASQLRSSYRPQPGQAPSVSGFTKSLGPGRERPTTKMTAIRPPSARPPAARSKVQAPRPKTSHGHRDEDLLDQTTITNGMSLRSQTGSIIKSFPNRCADLTECVVAFDVDGRVGEMESQFKELKDIVNSSLTEKKEYDDALELAKMRGRMKRMRNKNLQFSN